MAVSMTGVHDFGAHVVARSHRRDRVDDHKCVPGRPIAGLCESA